MSIMYFIQLFGVVIIRPIHFQENRHHTKAREHQLLECYTNAENPLHASITEPQSFLSELHGLYSSLRATRLFATVDHALRDP